MKRDNFKWTPRVSIIIPLYNKESCVLRALNSIVEQTFSNYEVIVVDDGSSDKGPEIVVNYDDPRFRLIKQLNAGPGSARNRGIAEARGELVAFLDADDEWLPNHLEDIVRLLDKLGEEVVSVSSGYFEHPSGISREPLWRARGITEGPFRLDPNTPPMAAVHGLAYISPWSSLLRAPVVRKWGGFYARDRCLYGEDAYLWLKILLNETVAFHLDPTVRFHSETSELSRNLPGPHPLEPFLLYPSEIEEVCPPHLRKLLTRILAIRAFKAACVFGYWGQWREARSIIDRFSVAGAWKLPYYVPAKVCSTPLGPSFGRLWRMLKRVRTH